MTTRNLTLQIDRARHGTSRVCETDLPALAPGQVRLLEVYADRAAYEAHLTAPHFLAYKAATAGMVRNLRLILADPILLGTKPGQSGTV